ncbi:MFS general substrate transporter [Athelia psychrophila]|uniref:MFS general substrate transporter n=1 Tax=Athelia psychrophila TaxID=1759441 RepID=A0A166H0G9_9AGAM|nr:MFS general substrate transporter [Fibularhizoctonia sp. CBS 109695]
MSDVDSEETPLVSHDGGVVESVYDRFTPARKWIFVAVISWTGMLPLCVTGSFTPSIPQIAEDLNTTGPVISLAVSISILATALGGMTWASHSTVYGRRPVYLVSLPVFCAGSFGIGRATSVPELFVWRFIQAFGASSGSSVGSGVIADIYRTDERGTAMGVFTGCTMLGPSIAPFVGGLASHYASWRYMQYLLGICALGALLAVASLLPETAHAKSREWRFVNPLAPLGLLRSPNILALSFVGTFTLLANFVLMIPLAYTIGATYGITNEALLGACFLPVGLGNIAGGVLAGRVSDATVRAWRARRKGACVPEDRLRAMLASAAVLVPLSVLGAGALTQWAPGRWGLGGNLVCLFFNGVGLTSVLTIMSAYAVDILHSRSAEAVSATKSFRSLVIACVSTAILPAIQTIGPLATDGIAAALAYIGLALVVVTIRYGERMRGWADVGYSVAGKD